MKVGLELEWSDLHGLFEGICTLYIGLFEEVIHHFLITVYLPFYSLECEILEDNDSVYFTSPIPKPLVPGTQWVFSFTYECHQYLNK